MSTTREILTIPLLAEEALFTGHFEDEFHFLSIYKSFFFLLLYLESGFFLVVAYLMVANLAQLRISVGC